LHEFITPAVKQAGWDVLSQIREEVFFTKGRIIVRGRLVTRGKAKRADYILYYKPNIPIALIEAKDNNYAVGDGMQQALEYAVTLDIPFVFSSNGDAFLFHDRTGLNHQTETELPLDTFPKPEALWSKYRVWKNLAPLQEEIFFQDYFEDAGGKEPRYYQRIAINKAIEAIAKGQNRILLVMATGTGKTYTAFQIIWRQYIRLFVWLWRDNIIEMGRGIAFPSISRQQIEDLPIPLPPLAEQHRIVAKADELMAICVELESRLSTTATTRRQLLEATLSEAIAL
jgi:type I site-specific restriction endonuclease